MANHFGYNQQYTDKPGMWNVDGYAVVIDGYGTLEVQVNRLSTTGVLTAVLQNPPSSVVKSIVQSANNSGIYTINLYQTWVELDMVHVETTIPSGLSPANLIVQQLSNTVANSLYGPGQTAGLQGCTFTTIVPNTGSAGSLPQGSGIFFHLRLQNTST
jgi:hypothetical protein